MLTKFGNLNFDIIYKLQIGKFMYRYKSGLLPESFINMLLVTDQVHSYSTRRSELFYLTLYRTNIRIKVLYQCPRS